MSAGVRQLKPDQSNSQRRHKNVQPQRRWRQVFSKGRRLRRCPGGREMSTVCERFDERGGKERGVSDLHEGGTE